MYDHTQEGNAADDVRDGDTINSASRRGAAGAHGVAVGRRRSTGSRVLRVVLVSLLVLAIISVWGLLRAVAAQVYFEPTEQALESAAHGRHAEAVWAILLFVTGFVSAVASERMVLLLNVAPPLLAVASGNAVVVAAGCVLVGLVDVAMVPIVLLTPKGRRSGRGGAL